VPIEEQVPADGDVEGEPITVTGTAQRQAWHDRVLPPVEKVRPGVWSVPTPFPHSPLRLAGPAAAVTDLIVG
jgi:hypothetical protein